MAIEDFVDYLSRLILNIIFHKKFYDKEKDFYEIVLSKYIFYLYTKLFLYQRSLKAVKDVLNLPYI